MFRIATIPLARSLIVTRRTFVSSVLLTRTWENESVAQLRKEAKNRGLSPKGNKSNLILRIQESDRGNTLDAITSHEPLVPLGARNTSTDAAASVEGVTPGIPPAAQSTHAIPKLFMNTNIPDISQPDPEPPIQIPYVPDFWESSKVTQAEEKIQEPVLPKLLVVAGATTHHGGGPSHNLHDVNESIESDIHVDSTPIPTKSGQGGIWQDVAEDIGLPPLEDAKKAFFRVFS